MPYLYILLSASCSVLIAHLLKRTEVNKLRTLPTLTVNYLTAALLAFVAGWEPAALQNIAKSPGVLLFCLGVGAFFIGNFLMYSKSVHANGVGVTIAAMRVSLLVPVVVSIYLYGEQVTTATAAGIAGVLGALVLLVPRKGRVRFGAVDAGWLLLMIFLVAGFADASLKVYQEDFRMQLNEQLFMGVVFTAAFLIGVGAMLVRRQKGITGREWVMGSLIGIPNLYSSIFLIYALADIDGAIAYPLVNALNVAAGTALGLWIWDDAISRLQWLGIAIAIAAIILLV